FDLDHLGKSAAQFDEAKLRWVNAQHMKAADDTRLAALVAGHMQAQGWTPPQADALARMCAVFKDRCATTVELAQWLAMYVPEVPLPTHEREAHLAPAIRPAVESL